MNSIRFTNRLFGVRIHINEPDRVQLETNKPLLGLDVDNIIIMCSKFYDWMTNKYDTLSFDRLETQIPMPMELQHGIPQHSVTAHWSQYKQTRWPQMLNPNKQTNIDLIETNQRHWYSGTWTVVVAELH